MSLYKLTYFDGRGRAEVSRLLLAAAKVKYDDVRVKFDDWPALKPKTPFGHLPILEFDGKTIAESSTLVRFLAHKHDLAGVDFEKVLTDMIFQMLEDLQDKIPMFEKDEVKKAASVKDLYETRLVPSFEKLTEMKKNAKKKYLISDSLTYADVALLHFCDTFERYREGFMKDFKCLNEVIQEVKKNPGIAEWLEKRPKTQF